MTAKTGWTRREDFTQWPDGVRQQDNAAVGCSRATENGDGQSSLRPPGGTAGPNINGSALEATLYKRGTERVYRRKP